MDLTSQYRQYSSHRIIHNGIWYSILCSIPLLSVSLSHLYSLSPMNNRLSPQYSKSLCTLMFGISLIFLSYLFYIYLISINIMSITLSYYMFVSYYISYSFSYSSSYCYYLPLPLQLVSCYLLSVYVYSIICTVGPIINSLTLYIINSVIVYLNSIVLSVSGLLFSLICCIYWIRDGIREYTSTYMSVIVLISVSLLGILVSESILFATLFLSLFQPLSSYLYSLEGVYTSDPSSHTYSNTIILSNSGISLGYVLVIRDVYRLHLLLPLYVWIIALTFLHIQIKEFFNITYYMNESIYVSMFFSLLGLHLFHILIGILLIGLILWTSCYSRSVPIFTGLQLIVTSHQLSSTLQLVYWHFVDLLWLIIFYVLYN